jgi:hypothetical protein
MRRWHLRLRASVVRWQQLIENGSADFPRTARWRPLATTGFDPEAWCDRQHAAAPHLKKRTPNPTTGDKKA